MASPNANRHVEVNVSGSQPVITANPRHTDTRVQPDENYGDSSGGLWSMYLTEAEKQDMEKTESWKGDTEGILVFTGLFSATVAAFIIESYKQLSPDSGEATVVLLTQISRQLVNISNGTPLESLAPQSSRPFKPTASAIRINVMWFLSLVLSLTSALSATLMQRWARRYLALAQRRGAPHKRARMRAYIYDGVQRFGISRAVETMPTLLHISVFLFLVGLIDFLIPIDTIVAYFTLGWIVAFTLAYATLTVLPNLYLNCPYRTPLSGFTWRLSQFSVLGILSTVLEIEDLFHEPLLKLWNRVNPHMTRPHRLTRWRDLLETQVRIHREWLSDGLRKSVERSATSAPSAMDVNALEWTLKGLDEDKEIEDFATRVPGFFESLAVPDAPSTILSLISDQPATDPILGSRLYDLLQTCRPGVSRLSKEMREGRLRVCLKCLWYCGRAYDQLGDSMPLSSYISNVFARPDMTHRIRTEQDLAALVTGHCFLALVAKKLAADIKLRPVSTVRVSEGELACLSAILRTDGRTLTSWFDRPRAIGLANVVSLMSEKVGSVNTNTVPSDVLDLLQQTLRILSEGLLAEENANPPLDQIQRFQEIYPEVTDGFKSELQRIWEMIPLHARE